MRILVAVDLWAGKSIECSELSGVWKIRMLGRMQVMEACFIKTVRAILYF